MSGNSPLRNSIGTFERTKSLSSRVRTYAELQRQIHQDLRVQHPEWVKPNGESQMCDLYERRLAELIAFFQSTKANLTVAES